MENTQIAPWMDIAKGYDAHKKATIKLAYGFLKQRQEIYMHSFEVCDSNGELFYLEEAKYNKRINIRFRDVPKKYYRKISSSLYRRGLVYGVRFNFDLFDSVRGYSENIHYLQTILEEFESNFRKIHHLGPLRTPPSRSYLFSGELSDKIGISGEKALLNYGALSKRRINKGLESIVNVNNALYRLGFMSEFEYRKVGERHYEFWGKHPESNYWANIADSGFGSSQVLPILLQLFTAKQESLILIEQPELHLHPAAQSELGSVIVEACKANSIRVVMETHSENLILRIQTEVARGNLLPSEITIYYVDPSNNGHSVIEIPLDEKGCFLNEWPKGFFPEGYDESIKLAKVREGIIE
jgi:hypothetical protein